MGRRQVTGKLLFAFIRSWSLARRTCTRFHSLRPYALTRRADGQEGSEGGERTLCTAMLNNGKRIDYVLQVRCVGLYL